LNIFLSVPFSSRIDADGIVEKTYRESIETLLAGLRKHGHTVYCALEYAAWQMGGLTDAEKELTRDFTEIDKTDKLLVLLEERISAGVQLECRYAYAKRKVIEVYQTGEPAWTNKTFAKVNGHDLVFVQTTDDFVAKALARN
jgi:hypothetical protein